MEIISLRIKNNQCEQREKKEEKELYLAPIPDQENIARNIRIADIRRIY